MKAIPLGFVKANQTMLVFLTLSSLVFQSAVLLAVTVMIAWISLLFGPKANPAVMVYRRFVSPDPEGETEAAELARFNQSIAAVLISLGFVLHVVFQTWAAWLPVLMVTVAASAALLGYCIGCVIYFQYKKVMFKLKKKRSSA
ncbi:hypothetical protein CR205_06705 [Alteribacter lacisalsi]|uniref:DUF4395 domain-containing protein n=1 Tax=Alteribacter lacisalsi TaxID=2045244 RepID=A0A2W0HMI2_9BACI|nr:DUF4395 domain-containing protein [Alteribacter lacisalsi]PYZ98282.1 hypothetical protein CR205_06705 [Alteribacter lacisalsi]